MAHFQLLPERRPYSTRIGAARLFWSGNTGTEAIVIETGKTVALEIGGLAAGAKPVLTQIVLSANASAITQSVINVLGLKPPAGAGGADIVSATLSGRRVTLSAVRPGTCLLFVDGANPLVVMAGSFQNHTDMEHDLIADVFRSSDPERMHVLNHMLNNDRDNLFNEKSDSNVKRWGQLACGTVSKVGGAAVFYDKLNYDYQAYYDVPIRGRKREDIKINSTKLDRGRRAIQTRLAKRMPSVVGLVYIPSTAIQNGRVNVTGAGGHSVPIVGCSKDGKSFLYIDVWPAGSHLKYEGGHIGRDLFPNVCDYLGLFELQHDPVRKIDILRSTTPGSFNGDTFLEVVAGPLD